MFKYGYKLFNYYSAENKLTFISKTSSICLQWPSLFYIKYSISAYSNSLTLNNPFLGAISFLNEVPTYAKPNGSYYLAYSKPRLKFIKIPWAVSGLKYAFYYEDGPIDV